MSNRIYAAAGTLLALMALAFVANTAQAQDPTVVDSTHYTVEFENDEVRVVRIGYGPGEKSVMHEHPAGVVVILTDASRKFTNSDGTTEEFSNEAGEAFWAPATKHLPESTHNEPFEVILVEVKGETPSLYERLGGIYAIATVVDDFIERLLVNDILNANPVINEARASVPKAGLKYRVTALMGQVTGGPQTYTGRSMKESHAHMNITEPEWQAMMADFQATLDYFEVPSQEQGELIDIVKSTKADIVMAEEEGM